jgi:hypothetical protein
VRRRDRFEKGKFYRYNIFDNPVGRTARGGAGMIPGCRWAV